MTNFIFLRIFFQRNSYVFRRISVNCEPAKTGVSDFFDRLISFKFANDLILEFTVLIIIDPVVFVIFKSIHI